MEFSYSPQKKRNACVLGGLLLLCYVKIQCMFLATIISWFHTILQVLYLRTACAFHFDPAEVVLVHFLGLYWLRAWLEKKSFSAIDKFSFPCESFGVFLIESITRLIGTGIFLNRNLWVAWSEWCLKRSIGCHTDMIFVVFY